MRSPRNIAVRNGRYATIFLFTSFLVTPCAFAQFGAPPAQTQETPANQLPLSGRGGQSGSVTASQSPVPGTTTSVNTINPTVQIQGAFAGSVRSTAKIPFSGRLSLREAIDRGLE